MAKYVEKPIPIQQVKERKELKPTFGATSIVTGEAWENPTDAYYRKKAENEKEREESECSIYGISMKKGILT